VSAVDQHTKLYSPRPPVVEQGIERRADGAAGVEDIVHQHHVLAGYIEAQIAALYYRLGAHGGKVVAVQSDIESSSRYIRALDLTNQPGKAFGERYAPPAYPHKRQIGDTVILFHDFMGKAYQRALDFRGRKQLRFLAQVRRTSLGGCGHRGMILDSLAGLHSRASARSRHGRSQSRARRAKSDEKHQKYGDCEYRESCHGFRRG